MKVLITGASGLLGANLVQLFNDKGICPKVFLRKTSDLTALDNLNYEKYYGDLSDYNSVDNAVKGCDLVIHSAAVTDQDSVSFDKFEKTNIFSTELLIRAGIKHNIQRFIHVSTANCYKAGSKANPGTESSGFDPKLKQSFYAYSKYQAELLVKSYSKEIGFPAVIVNPTFMLGARDAGPGSGRLLLMALKNPIMFYPKGGKNFVYVGDVAAGILKAVEKGRIGESYLLSGENMTYKEFFNELKTRHKQNLIAIKLSGKLVDFIGMIGWICEKLFKKSFGMNRANAYLLNLDNYYTSAKAEKELNYTYRPIKIAMDMAIDWFEDYQYISKSK